MDNTTTINTMQNKQNVWKIETHWGKYGPSNFDLFLNYQCAFFSLDDVERIGDWQSAKIGDLLLVCDGSKPIAIGIMQSRFENYQQSSIRFSKSDEDEWIDGSDNVRICKARFCRIPEGEKTASLGNDGEKQFCAHSNKDIVINKWREYEIQRELNSGKELISLTYEQLAYARATEIFSIPAVQRGVVWSPLQVINLWDSIIKGYPIGSLMIYKEGNQWRLFDGQQRTISLCYGYDPNDIKIWCRKSQETDDIQFMATTMRHPWGFKWVNGEGHRELAVLTWKEREAALSEMFPEKSSFDKLDIQEGYPYDYKEKNKDKLTDNYYIPLEWLIKYKEEEITSWNKYIPKTENVESYKIKYRELAEDHRIRAIIDGKRQVPILIIPENTIKNKLAIRELFYRINKGGSELSKNDDLYSELCVKCDKVKENIDELCSKDETRFLPASRLCVAAARMAMSENGVYQHSRNLYTVIAQLENEDSKNMFMKLIASREDATKSYWTKSLSDALAIINTGLKTTSKDYECYRSYKYILLRDTNDDWLYVIIYLMCSIKKYDSERDGKYIPLLSILPFLTCCTNASKIREIYAQQFFQGISDFLKSESDVTLLQVIAVGYLHVALFQQHIVYPLNANASDHCIVYDFPENSGIGYGTWGDMFTKVRGRSENFALYLYQRAYIHKLLGSYFNPASVCTWEDENRPWDMDHIIPDEWWSSNNNKPLAYHKDAFYNMQALHFHDNRRKSNQHAGSVSVDANDEIYNLAHDFENITKDNVHIDGMKLLMKRRDKLAQRVLKDHKFGDLVAEINKLNYGTELTKCARVRYDLFNEIHKIISKNHSTSYSIVFARTAYQRNNRKTYILGEENSMLYCIKNENWCFYSSLVPWLVLGIQINNNNSLYGIQCAIEAKNGKYYFKVQIGIMRGPDTTANTWMSDEHTSDPWWNESSGSLPVFKECIDISNIVDIHVTAFHYCEKIVDYFNRHNGEASIILFKDFT